VDACAIYGVTKQPLNKLAANNTAQIFLKI
jgi:hypothetical protein